MDLIAGQTKIKNELIQISADLQTKNARLRRLEIDLTGANHEKEKTDSDLNDILAACRAYEEEFENAKKKLASVNELFSSSSNALESIKQKISDSKSEIKALDSKEELLREMIEKHEGFAKSVKAVMEARGEGRLKGVIGLLGDMISASEGYESALEVALGESSQAVVVADRAALSEALGYLRDNNIGGAYFITHEDVKNARGKPAGGFFAKRYTGTPLSEFVKIDENYKEIRDYLLGNIYMARTIEEAKEKLDRTKEDISFVTKDGTFVKRGICFGGASVKDGSTSVVGRAGRLERIRKTKQDIASNIELFLEEEKTVKIRIEEIRNDIIKAQENSREKELLLANADSKKQTVLISLKKSEDEICVIGLEIDEVKETLKDITKKGKELNEALNEKEREYNTLLDAISSSEARVEELGIRKNNLAVEASEIRSQLTLITNNEDVGKRDLERAQVALLEMKQELALKEKIDLDCGEKIKIFREETVNLSAEISEKQKEQEYFGVELERASTEKKDTQKELSVNEKLLREKEDIVNDLRNKVRNFEINEKEYELKIINLKDRINQAYKIDIQGFTVEIDENTNWEELRNQAEVLKIKLDKLGPVNLIAIDRKSTRLNSSHVHISRMPSSA